MDTDFFKRFHLSFSPTVFIRVNLRPSVVDYFFLALERRVFMVV